MKPCFDINGPSVAKTRIWVLNCALGTGTGYHCGKFKVNKPKGTILLQTSTGAILKVNLTKNYDNQKGILNQRIYGSPTQQGVLYISPSKKTQVKSARQIILWLEY